MTSTSGSMNVTTSAQVEPTQCVSRSRERTTMAKDSKHRAAASSRVSSLSKKTHRGLRSKTTTADPAPVPSRPKKKNRRSTGLEGTKFRPPRSEDQSSQPGAHGSFAQTLQERETTVSPTTLSGSQEGMAMEVTAVAHLVDHEIDEEAIRQQAEMDAERRLMKNVPRAEVVIPEDEQTQEKICLRRRRWIVILLLLLVLAAGTVAISLVLTRNKDKLLVRITLSPTTAPSLSPTEAPSEVPSMMPSDPFTNDFCQGARELEGGFWSSTNDATLDEGFATCGDIRNNGRGQWFQVEGDNAWLRVHTCNEATNYDTQLSVYQDEGLGEGKSSCLSATCVAGNDQFCGDQSFVQWFGEERTLYWILVHGYRHYTGEFSLEVLEEKNEVCEGALNLSRPIFEQESGTIEIETSMARAAPIDPDEIPLCRDAPKPTGVGIWFTYDGKFNFPELIVGNGLSLTVYSGSCGRLSCVELNGPTLEDEDGVTYFILVHGQDISQDMFHLILVWAQLGMFIPPQGNSFCEDVQDNPEYFLLSPGQVAMEGETNPFNAWMLAFQPVVELGSCGDGVFFSSDGLWYTVVGTGRPMTVSTCRNQSDTQYSREENCDTQISVFEGSCDSLVCIDGNDQFCGDQSEVSFFTEFNVSYSVLVHGYGSRSGAFEVSYGEVGTFGDSPKCEAAISIVADGSSILGTANFNESAFPIGFCGFGGTTNDSASSWFKVVGTGGTLTASTCSSNTDFSTRVSVYAGASCSDLVCVDSSVSPCGEQNAATWKSVAGQLYYLLIHGKDPAEEGNFVLTLEDTASNDECAGAIGPLNADGVTHFASTRSATFDDTVPSCSTSSDGRRAAAGRGVFYSVLGSGSNMTATTCLPYTNFDMQVWVYKGDCADLQCVDVQTAECPMTANNMTQLGTSVMWSSTQDQLYYLLFQGRHEEIGNFGVEVHGDDLS